MGHGSRSPSENLSSGELSFKVGDQSRRRFLVNASAVIGAGVAVGVGAPFVMSLAPSERARAAGAPIEVDISQIEPGMKISAEWRGKVVWVLHRSKEMVANLAKTDALVEDPKSEQEQQPAYAKNEHRSIKPEYLVLEGVCTHLGCSPTQRNEIAPADLGNDWFGGFFCPCHGSKFDLSGRVYKGVPAPLNLRVPPHHYVGDSKIVIGEDQSA
ncbi:MAG: ubiquinol-cytochrome c reductase iron-sulfur subunit [Pseudomonadota bacterium]